MSDFLQFALFLSLLREANVPAPVLELKFTPDRRWRFDFAWPERMVAVECEGGVWNYGRHNRPSGFIRDCEKYSKAAELGWRVLRYPRQHLTHKATIEQIARTLSP